MEARVWTPPVSGKADQDRRTPIALYRELELRYGRGKFTLDAACSPENCLIRGQLDPGDTWDALAEGIEWCGSVFVNPPWNNIEPWVWKAHAQVACGNASVAVLLVPARVTMPWWHFAVTHGAAVRWIRGRVAYGGSGPAPFEHSCVLVFESPIVASEHQPKRGRKAGSGEDAA